MEAREERVLAALAWMCRQYLQRNDDGSLDTLCMGAGELAILALAEYGIVDVTPGNLRSAVWTPKGHELLKTERLPG